MSESNVEPTPDGSEECLVVLRALRKKDETRQVWLVRGNGTQSKDLLWQPLSIPITRDTLAGGASPVLDELQSSRKSTRDWIVDDEVAVIPIAHLDKVAEPIAMDDTDRAEEARDAGTEARVNLGLGGAGADTTSSMSKDVKALADQLARLTEQVHEIRVEVSKHRTTESELNSVSKTVGTMSSQVSNLMGLAQMPARQSAPSEGVDEAIPEIARQLLEVQDRINTVNGHLGQLSEALQVNLTLAADRIESSLLESRDEVIASTSRALRSALPDLNLRFRDGQSVLIRLDRLVRAMIEDDTFDVSAEFGQALTGQLDDHLSEARVSRSGQSAQDSIYRDRESGEVLARGIWR